MPRDSYRKVFRDGVLLKKMLVMRSGGMGWVSLSTRFCVDHTSIMYQCRKYNVLPNCPLPDDLDKKIKDNTKRDVFIILNKKPSKVYKYQELLDDKINYGKSYKQYLKDSKKTK